MCGPVEIRGSCGFSFFFPEKCACRTLDVWQYEDLVGQNVNKTFVSIVTSGISHVSVVLSVAG
jgi:hypothetical protein